MNFNEAVQSFRSRFPEGGIDRCEFRPHIDGYVVNAFSTILPRHDETSTRDAAVAILADMVAFMKTHRAAFGAEDVVQLVVGFPESVKRTSRQIFKCWVPAKGLKTLRGIDFAGANGGLRELDTWPLGVEWKPTDPRTASE